MSMQVRVLTSAAEREAAYRLRYQIYIDEMRRPIPYADHARRWLTDDLDQVGTVLGLWLGDALVGTTRIHRLSEDHGTYRSVYHLGDVAMADRPGHHLCTALMLRPEVRGGGAALQLFEALYAWALTHGAHTAWLDCNPPLVPFFQLFGWHQDRWIDHPVFGRVALMRLDLRDRAHLERARSPLVRVLDAPHTFLPTRSEPMSMMSRFRADFDQVAARFHENPACARFRAGEATVAEYASLLRSVAHQTRENPQIQAYATAYFRGDQRPLVKGFLRHAVSEIGHDQLACNDVAALGYPTAELFAQEPLPSATALTAYAYYTIDHVGPVSYLGYLFFLEFLPTTFGAEYAQALDRMGVPPEARSFLHDHATVDVGHNQLMDRYVAELVKDETTYAQVRYAMEVTGALYARMVEDAFAAAAALRQGRPLVEVERSGLAVRSEAA